MTSPKCFTLWSLPFDFKNLEKGIKITTLSATSKDFSRKASKILYGGSVNPKNINNLKMIKDLDGFLIGGASQNSKNFIDIVKKTYN